MHRLVLIVGQGLTDKERYLGCASSKSIERVTILAFIILLKKEKSLIYRDKGLCGLLISLVNAIGIIISVRCFNRVTF